MLFRVLKSILPSMLAFAFSGLYAIVDGFFIGQSIGDVGLAAVNIAFPLTVVIQAAGTGLGMGGAVELSLARGRGEEAQVRRFLTNTLELLAVAGLVLLAVLQLICRPVLGVLGAEGAVLEASIGYTRVIALGAVFQCFATGLAPLLRNYDGALAAMGAMIAGFVTNIVLDYLFVMVFSWGTPGAAWATIIGQAVTVLPCAFCLSRRVGKVFRGDWLPRGETIRTILKVALSPFGLTLTPNLAILLLNKGASLWGGATAVAAYAVVSYVTAVVQLLLQGVGDGSQPLMSLNIGMGRPQEAKQVRTIAYLCAGITAAGTMLALFLLRGAVPGFFGASAEAAPLAAHSLPIFILSFPFTAFCRTSTAYFYATQKNRYAYCMIYGEPILLAAAMFLVLPRFWALDGVWMSVPVVQAILTGLGLLFLRLDRTDAANPKKEE